MQPSPANPQSIREMFGMLAPSYDLSNNLISFGQHLRWKRLLVELSGVQPGMRVLDCASGTGDIAFAFARVLGASGNVIASDFSAGMMAVGAMRQVRGSEHVSFEHADVTALPYTDDSFDCASIGFGIRNVPSPDRALREMARVVKPGGCVMVLETGQPQGAFMKPTYYVYSRYIVPLIGGLVSGSLQAYNYLHSSSHSFPCGEEFVAIMRRSGCFGHIESHRLCWGAAYIYKGVVL
ncbi:MAG: class I SAM-dependent methyltransferase [bacterium]